MRLPKEKRSKLEEENCSPLPFHKHEKSSVNYLYIFSKIQKRLIAVDGYCWLKRLKREEETAMLFPGLW